MHLFQIIKHHPRLERLVYAVFILKRNPLLLFGSAVIAAMIIAALIPSYIAPFPGDALYEIHFDQKLKPPSVKHFFGTDHMGRDIFSRVVFGSRMSIKIALLVILISLALGVPFGLIAGYWGGSKIDEIIMRISDMLLAFPPLLLPMAITAALGPSIMNMMIAISISWFPWYVRLIRGQVLSLKEELYVESARSIGAGRARIIMRHIFPNSISLVIVQASMDMGYAILTAASLSFIGLGARPPTVEWGLMVTTSRAHFLDFWWTATFPGLAIFISVLGFNLVGDGLRDILDPKLRA